MDLLDQADINSNQILEAQIANRERFTKWDGKPRECEDCLNNIPTERLRAINADTCVHCAERRERK